MCVEWDGRQGITHYVSELGTESWYTFSLQCSSCLSYDIDLSKEIRLFEFYLMHISNISLCIQLSVGSLFNIEVKVTGSAKMKQNKDEAVSEDINKEIDFIILEHRDITSNRVTLSVDMDPIKTSSLSSDKSSATASNSSGDKKTFRLPEMTQFREPLVLEALCPLGLVLCKYLSLILL